MEKVLEWVFADSLRVFIVQMAFSTSGALLAAYGLLEWGRRKLRHEVLPREVAVESDCRALRIFAGVIFGLEILGLCCDMYDWLSWRFSLGPLLMPCIGWLIFAGLVIAVRSRIWWYVLLIPVQYILGVALNHI